MVGRLAEEKSSKLYLAVVLGTAILNEYQAEVCKEGLSDCCFCLYRHSVRVLGFRTLNPKP